MQIPQLITSIGGMQSLLMQTQSYSSINLVGNLVLQLKNRER